MCWKGIPYVFFGGPIVELLMSEDQICETPTVVLFPQLSIDTREAHASLCLQSDPKVKSESLIG